ncbi:MAG: PEPxxWA-CTERM sorting domain-containing protein [Pseudomonadota bacterium]|nr:PEPxxWA-CTERM sorting domain-containing protein [Pseudomonadota bacterium]
MVGRATAFVACLLASAASPTLAAEKIYTFSGQLNFAALFEGSLNPDWGFADGQSFSGTFGYDPSRISVSQVNFASAFGADFSRYFSPITSLTYTIQTPNGPFTYSPPITTLSGSPATFALVRSGLGLDNAVALNAFNYQASFTGQDPVPVPASGLVGPYYAHSTVVSFSGPPGYFTNPGPNINFAAMGSGLGTTTYGNLAIRFSDPKLWAPGQERGDGLVLGNITSLRMISVVPEPSTWLMMILGIGVVGLGLRARRSEGTVTA